MQRVLARHAFAYLLSHGVPAIVGFVGIALYSRWLTPEEYGRYALLFASAAVLNAVVFEWLKVSVLRLQRNGAPNEVFYMSVKVVFFALMGITFVCASGFWLLSNGSQIDGFLILLALVLSWGQSWYQLNLSLLRAELKPLQYGKVAFARAVLGLALASLFIWFGYAEIGLLLGLIGGLLLSTMPLFRKRWGFSIKPALVSLPLLRSYAAYGLPLTITLLLGMIIHQSDRFIIGAMMGVEATGSYAVTYDLTEQSIFTLLLIVNLAAFPLAVKKLDNEGEQAANRQVKANMTLLLAIGLPMLIGFVMARESIATLFLGEAFRDTAVSLIPFIAVGALLKGFKLYGIDILFHLKKTNEATNYSGCACCCGQCRFNDLVHSSYGLQGAAIATVIAYALAILSSWFLLYFQQTSLPFPVKGFVKIMCAGTVMFSALLPFSSESSAFALISQILIGIFSYSVVLGLLSVKQIRLFLRKRTKQNETA